MIFVEKIRLDISKELLLNFDYVKFVETTCTEEQKAIFKEIKDDINFVCFIEKTKDKADLILGIALHFEKANELISQKRIK